MSDLQGLQINNTDYIVKDNTARLMIVKPFDATVAYNINDYCIYNGTVYKRKISGAAGAWDSALWMAMSDNIAYSITSLLNLIASEWQADTTYTDNDLVWYMGSLYRCKKGQTKASTFSTNNFQLVTDINSLLNNLKMMSMDTPYELLVSETTGTAAATYALDQYAHKDYLFGTTSSSSRGVNKLYVELALSSLANTRAIAEIDLNTANGQMCIPLKLVGSNASIGTASEVTADTVKHNKYLNITNFAISGGTADDGTKLQRVRGTFAVYGVKSIGSVSGTTLDLDKITYQKEDFYPLKIGIKRECMVNSSNL